MTSRNGHTFMLLVLCMLVLLLSCSKAYRVGDAVDTLIRTASGTMDARRHQMPQFGVDSSALFAGMEGPFSLSFEDGLRPLPWFELNDRKGDDLVNVIVTFVYSRSGDGAIHAISSEPSYGKQKRENELVIHVKYKWVEEEAVDVASGAAVMLIATVLASVMFLVQTCRNREGDRMLDDGASDVSSYASYGSQQGVALGAAASVPKWD